MAEDLSTLSDEAKRKLLKPQPANHQQVEEAAQKSFLQSRDDSITIMKQLDSYDDVNYLVERSSDKTKFLLKIHNGVESADYISALRSDESSDDGGDSVIHLQNAMMQYLNQHNLRTSDPMSVVGDKNEESAASAYAAVHSLPVVSTAHSPQPLVLRLLSWIPGRTLSSLPTSLPLECLLQAGVYLGKLDGVLDSMKEDHFTKAAHRYHAWDGKNTADLRQYLDYIDDTRRRGMVVSIINAFQEQILDANVPFRTGLLQADYNDANIIVNDGYEVTGVIDFGDSVTSWRVLDISVAMAYAMLSQYGKQDRHISAAAAMLRGFHSVYPLQEIERKHLPLLMACRLACSACIGAFSYQQNPENKYLLLHAEPAWRALETVWGHDDEKRPALQAALHATFDLACDYAANERGEVGCLDLAFPDPSIADPLVSIRANASTDPRVTKRQKVNASNGSGGKPVITFVTGNKKKLEEVKRILGSGSESNLPFEISNHKLDLPELQCDPMDIAKEKCCEAAVQLGGAVITEDTSLCFTALHGLPGPYVKWFLDKCGHSGLIDMIASSTDKSAYAQTVVAFCPGPGQEVVLFDGRTMGKIVPARGALDFGWDPVFEPDEGGGKTYAEMSKEAKDAISHRSRAFAKLRELFANETDSIASSISS